MVSSRRRTASEYASATDAGDTGSVGKRIRNMVHVNTFGLNVTLSRSVQLNKRAGGVAKVGAENTSH